MEIGLGKETVQFENKTRNDTKFLPVDISFVNLF